MIVGAVATWLLLVVTFLVLGITVNPNFFAGIAAAFVAAVVFSVAATDLVEDPRPAMHETRRAIERARIKRRELLAGRTGQSAVSFARYKEHLPYLVESYRQRVRKYRRAYIALQGIVIVGSLSASAIVAASRDEVWRIAAILMSLAVSIAATSLATFRIRERADNLHATANDIEREYRAAELGIGRYADERDDRERLRLLVESVEDLRFNQANVERQLEQPPDTKLPSGVDTAG